MDRENQLDLVFKIVLKLILKFILVDLGDRFDSAWLRSQVQNDLSEQPRIWNSWKSLQLGKYSDFEIIEAIYSLTFSQLRPECCVWKKVEWWQFSAMLWWRKLNNWTFLELKKVESFESSVMNLHWLLNPFQKLPAIDAGLKIILILFEDSKINLFTCFEIGSKIENPDFEHRIQFVGLSFRIQLLSE